MTYPEKTRFVLFGVRHLISQLPNNITVPFLGQALIPVTSAKDLGVTLDSNLPFNSHIASLTSHLLSTLVQINRVRHLFAKEVMCIILNSLVFSKLFYCATVWFGAPKENIHELQLIQNFAGRILTNTKKFYHITPVLHELGLLTIEELLCVRDVTMIFKCLNDLVPSFLNTKFVKGPETHSHSTRQNNEINLTSLRAEPLPHSVSSVSGRLNQLEQL